MSDTAQQAQRAIPCLVCGKRFRDENARYLHTKAKHGKKAGRAVRPERDDREPSMGQQLAEAQFARAIGEPVDAWVEAVFGDYL